MRGRSEEGHGRTRKSYRAKLNVGKLGHGYVGDDLGGHHPLVVCAPGTTGSEPEVSPDRYISPFARKRRARIRGELARSLSRARVTWALSYARRTPPRNAGKKKLHTIGGGGQSNLAFLVGTSHRLVKAFPRDPTSSVRG